MQRIEVLAKPPECHSRVSGNPVFSTQIFTVKKRKKLFPFKTFITQPK